LSLFFFLQNEKSKEQVELELIPKISEAVKLGLNVLDTAYEKLVYLFVFNFYMFI